MLTLIHILIRQDTGDRVKFILIIRLIGTRIHPYKDISIKKQDFIMSDTNNDNSDIKKAADQTDSQQIKKNLEDGKPVDVPESLTEEEKTSFINDDLRTDK